MVRCNTKDGENGETRGNSNFPRAGKWVLTTGKVGVKSALRFYPFPVSTIPGIFSTFCSATNLVVVSA